MVKFSLQNSFLILKFAQGNLSADLLIGYFPFLIANYHIPVLNSPPPNTNFPAVISKSTYSNSLPIPPIPVIGSETYHFRFPFTAPYRALWPVFSELCPVLANYFGNPLSIIKSRIICFLISLITSG